MSDRQNKFDWSDKTILIAEDEETNVMFLKAALVKTKVNVLHAVNGMEAIEMCRENNNIDIVLMDIKMPGVDGYEATKEIKAINNKIIIIALTAYAMEGDKERIIDAGCDDYIAKPVVYNTLLKRINKWI